MATESNRPGSPRRREAVAFWAIVAAAVGFYFWTAGLNGVPPFGLSPDGPYNLQAEGFRHGHLHISLDPDPALLALEDPYDPVANAPYRVHDMTLWRGRYYLYYGVAPVLLVFLPFRLLTGHFVTEPVVVALFTSLGLLASAKLLSDVRRRWFPAAHPLLFLALAGVLGFGCPAVFLDQMPQFYQVPISCAYAFGMAGLLCVARVLAAAARQSAGWLLASGACMGMTLAARPNYLLAMPLLLVPAWWCVRAEGGWHAGWARWQRPLALAFGPVAAIGLALMAYNYLRFGDPLEFGVRFQLTGQSFVNLAFLSPGYFPADLSIYAWKRIWWLPYFPFVESEPEVPFGLMRYLPVVWLGLAAFWCRGAAEGEGRPGRLALAGAIVWLGAANLAVDSFVVLPELRYVTDFGPEFMLLGAVGALSIGHTGSRSRWTLPPLLLAAAATVLFIFAVYVQRTPEQHRPSGLARFCDRLAARAEEALGQRFGRLRLEVELPRRPEAAVEPLFQTGHGTDRRDSLLVHYLPQDHALLGFFHAGLGEILGRPISLPPDRRLLVEVEDSAFLPPGTHPLFASWTPDEIAEAQRTLQVTANGSVVLAAALPCYPSRPWDLQLGTSGFPGDAARPRFSGRLVSSEMIPARREALPQRELTEVHGVLDIRLQMPALGRGGFEPLISTGEKSLGQLLYLVYGPDYSVQFALDTFGSGTLFSRPLTCSPAEVFTVKAWMGAWAAAKEGRAGWVGAAFPGIERRFFVSINGMVLFDADHQFNPGADSPTSIGRNGVDSGAAAQEFSGRILSIGQEELSSLPSMGAAGSYGEVDMRVMLPVTAPGQAEPLVTTGEPGAGDILYVRYVDDAHVALGLDTSGGSGPSTDPLPVDYAKPQSIEVSMGSLYPEGMPDVGGRLLVRLNGQVVLDGISAFHPSAPDRVQIGYNSIGGSACSWEFTGRILSVARPAVPKR